MTAQTITEAPAIVDDVKPDVSAVALRPASPSADLQLVLQTGELFVKSGFFPDVKSLSQAAVKIMAGAEYGFGPFDSMRGVYIINGRTALEANLLAKGIKRSGRYDYRVVEITDQVCTIDFFEYGKPIGRSSFTTADAKRAETKNMNKFPRNMLFARSLSNGQRWFCPDAFGSAPTPYVVEELNGDEAQPEATQITEPRRKSEASLPGTQRVVAGAAEVAEAEIVEGKPAPPDTSKPYRVKDVTAGVSPQTITIVTSEGQSFLADARLKVAAKSAMQTGAACIFGFGQQSEAWWVTEIEEVGE